MQKNFLRTAFISALLVIGSALAIASAPMRYAGTLTFSPTGVLFVADNVTSQIFAIETGQGKVPVSQKPLEVDHIDSRVAEVLGVSTRQVTLNGMAIHPTTQEVYLSVSRSLDGGILPAIIKVSARGELEVVDLSTAIMTSHTIGDPPSSKASFRSRAGDWPVPSSAKYNAKAQIPMRSMTVVDMKFHNGELYASGISNEEFSSTLRRIAYPFTGKSAESKIRMYHVAHTQYETRAPIRAMEFVTIDGEDTLIAAYTCSPLVLIPVTKLVDGAKVTGKTIGDMGNGQPISMFKIDLYGKSALFVTNMGHGPRIIPTAGFDKAISYIPENSPKGYPSDLSPEYPLGPVGKSVMFVGASIRAAKLNDKFIVSLTRDTQSGDVNLEALPVAPLPMKLDQIWSEFDFPKHPPKA